MLDSFRKGQRWLTFLFVSVIGLVFVFFFGTGGGLQPSAPTGNAVIELDDLRLTGADLERERRNQEFALRQQLGDEAYEQIGADRYLDSQALNALISETVLETAAEDLGLHVTKDELRRVVQTQPAFLNDQGRFDPKAFDVFATRQYGSQRLFIETFSRQMLAQKLVQLLISQTEVSDNEIDLRTRYDNEEVRIAYVALDPTRLPEGVSLSESEVADFAANHEDRIEALFAEREASLAKPERVRARHILIRLAEDAPDEIVAAATERAQAARDRLVGGEDFAAVAADVSQDAGTKDVGGDLGAFARGDNDPAVDEAAFAAEVGAITDVVRSPYGLHILRIDERLEAETPSLEDVRDELAREAAEIAKARDFADTTSAALAEALEDGTSLEQAVRDAGLTLERPAAIRRRPDGFIAGLGAAEEIMSAAFALRPGEKSARVYDIDGQRILFEVVEKKAPTPDELAAERSTQRAQVLTEKQNRIVSAWLDDYRAKLEASGRLRINAELALGRG